MASGRAQLDRWSANVARCGVARTLTADGSAGADLPAVMVIDGKQVFGAWPLVLAALAAVLVDGVGLWRCRHSRGPALALALAAVGLILIVVSVMFTGLLVAVMRMG